LETGEAAYGEERDVARFNTVAFGCEGVAVLVQDDAEKERQDENYPAYDGGEGFAARPVNEDHPRYDEKEGRVDIDRNTAEFSELPGPFHRYYPHAFMRPNTCAFMPENTPETRRNDAF